MLEKKRIGDKTVTVLSGCVTKKKLNDRSVWRLMQTEEKRKQSTFEKLQADPEQSTGAISACNIQYTPGFLSRGQRRLLYLKTKQNKKAIEKANIWSSSQNFAMQKFYRKPKQSSVGIKHVSLFKGDNMKPVRKRAPKPAVKHVEGWRKLSSYLWGRVSHPANSFQLLVHVISFFRWLPTIWYDS